jgi:hypothetical protein
MHCYNVVFMSKKMSGTLPPMFSVSKWRMPPRLFLAKAKTRILACASVFVRMLECPAEGLRYIRDQRDGRTPLQQGQPYFSWGAIDFLRQRVKPGSRLFEYGSGGSTIFFLNLDCEVTSVETSSEWVGMVSQAVGSHLKWHLIEHCHDNPTKDQIAAFPRYIRTGAPWDIVVVDNTETENLRRVSCVAEAIRCIRPGGMLVFDDAHLPEYREVPKVLAGWRRQSFKGLGTARPWVTMTDIYTAPSA